MALYTLPLREAGYHGGATSITDLLWLSLFMMFSLNVSVSFGRTPEVLKAIDYLQLFILKSEYRHRILPGLK